MNKKEQELYIKILSDIDLDITVIEILDKDNISKDRFLFPQKINIYNNNYINSSRFIPQYPNREELKNDEGKLTKINKYIFTHLASTEGGSSGSPIFFENEVDIIGIQWGSNKAKKEN